MKKTKSPDRAESGGIAVALNPNLPSKGWTESVPVPEEIAGSTVLFVGSRPDTSELVIDYRTAQGQELRMVLGFSERGMWIEHRCPLPSDSSESLKSTDSKSIEGLESRLEKQCQTTRRVFEVHLERMMSNIAE